MKRLLFLLPLLCLAAHADEIEGWKVTSGKWSQENDSLHTTGGTLLYVVKAKKGFMLKCRITVHEWLSEKGYSNACVFWAFKGTKPGEPEWENRHAFVIKPDYVRVAGPQGAGVKTHQRTWPLRKSVSVTIKSTPNKTEISFGRTKIATYSRYTDPNAIALVVTEADVTYEKIKIKTK
ncbi:MAG: hypothetical protein GXP25_15110 [Planctomycetes bacterium]|nr:hypothetical protein [Planctomycetota bacterium]